MTEQEEIEAGDALIRWFAEQDIAVPNAVFIMARAIAAAVQMMAHDDSVAAAEGAAIISKTIADAIAAPRGKVQ